jgi:uncharacterized protein YndB with AHSA1/START domain
MSDGADFSLEYELDAPLALVWQSIITPALRDRWFTMARMTHDPVVLVPERVARYRLRDDDPPFFQSEVTFHLAPSVTGGTRLRIVHVVTDVRLAHRPAANDDGPAMHAA